MDTRISALKKLRNPPPSAVLIYTTIIQTKDEIFLDILEKDYLSWTEDIREAMGPEEQPGREAYCRILPGRRLFIPGC